MNPLAVVCLTCLHFYAYRVRSAFYFLEMPLLSTSLRPLPSYTHSLYALPACRGVINCDERRISIADTFSRCKQSPTHVPPLKWQKLPNPLHLSTRSTNIFLILWHFGFIALYLPTHFSLAWHSFRFCALCSGSYFNLPLSDFLFSSSSFVLRPLYVFIRTSHLFMLTSAYDGLSIVCVCVCVRKIISLNFRLFCFILYDFTWVH